jgi:hypothetical protein
MGSLLRPFSPETILNAPLRESDRRTFGESRVSRSSTPPLATRRQRHTIAGPLHSISRCFLERLRKATIQQEKKLGNTSFIPRCHKGLVIHKVWLTTKKAAQGRSLLTASPGCDGAAARNAAMLSVVPAQTTQSSGKPARRRKGVRPTETFEKRGRKFGAFFLCEASSWKLGRGKWLR